MSPGPAPHSAPAASTALAAIMTRASELKYRPIKWLWPSRIARAKLTLLTGAPGSGKSALVASIIAAVTTGGAYPCGEGKAPHGSVILVSPEGDPDVLLPRLKAAGADLARVEIITRVPGPKGPRPFDIAHDMPLLDAAVRTVTDLRVVMFDALIPATGRAAAQATRRTARSARRARAGTRNCDAGGAAADGRRSWGAQGGALRYAGARGGARRLRNRDRPGGREAPTPVADEERACTPAFRITGREIEPGQTAARLEFEPQYNPLSAREFMARQGRSFDSERAEAIEFLRSLLGSAAKLQIRQVEQEARASGLLGANQQLSKCRVLRDARMAMGLAMTREGPNSSVWVWAKPGAQAPAVTSPPLQPGQTMQMQVAPAKS